jgi:hypothetical protein
VLIEQTKFHQIFQDKVETCFEQHRQLHPDSEYSRYFSTILEKESEDSVISSGHQVLLEIATKIVEEQSNDAYGLTELMVSFVLGTSFTIISFRTCSDSFRQDNIIYTDNTAIYHTQPRLA